MKCGDVRCYRPQSEHKQNTRAWSAPRHSRTYLSRKTPHPRSCLTGRSPRWPRPAEMGKMSSAVRGHGDSAEHQWEVIYYRRYGTLLHPLLGFLKSPRPRQVPSTSFRYEFVTSLPLHITLSWIHSKRKIYLEK